MLYRIFRVMAEKIPKNQLVPGHFKDLIKELPVCVCVCVCTQTYPLHTHTQHTHLRGRGGNEIE